MIFGLNGILGGATPFLVALIINHLGGYGSIFYYTGILTTLATVLIIVTPPPESANGPDPRAIDVNPDRCWKER